jgi:hypothetical protein
LRRAPAFGAGVVLITSWADLAGPAAGPARGDDTVRTYDAVWTTPSGTPLGGSVHLEVHDNGDYAIHFHAHSSSILGDFDFAVRAYLAVPDGPAFFFHHQGHVSGVDDADYDENGNNPLIRTYWSLFDGSAPFNVTKDYQWGGLVGTLEGLVRDVLDLTAGAVGTAIGAVIGVTREAIGWIGANLGPAGTIAVLAGVVVFAATGGSILLATVAGVAAGLVTDALVASRPMTPDEIALARQVFCDRIPYDKITLTNLHTVNNRAFTAPGVDGRTYVNLGPVYGNPLGSDGDAYPAPGQVLIHELTHAWQIAHTTFLPGLICSALVNQVNHSVFGDPIYEYGPAGPDWSTFNLEQQGAIVDQWFGGNGNSSGYAPMAWRNPYAHYIRHNIRYLGQDG